MPQEFILGKRGKNTPEQYTQFRGLQPAAGCVVFKNRLLAMRKINLSDL